jgi:hypothetical protein
MAARAARLRFRSRAATVTNARRTMGWLLGHDAPRGFRIRRRRGAPASYGRTRRHARFSPCPATQVSAAAATASAACLRRPPNAMAPAAPIEAHSDPSSVMPRKKWSSPGLCREELNHLNRRSSSRRPRPFAVRAARPRAVAMRLIATLPARSLSDDNMLERYEGSQRGARQPRAVRTTRGP